MSLNINRNSTNPFKLTPSQIVSYNIFLQELDRTNRKLQEEEMKKQYYQQQEITNKIYDARAKKNELNVSFTRDNVNAFSSLHGSSILKINVPPNEFQSNMCCGITRLSESSRVSKHIATVASMEEFKFDNDHVIKLSDVHIDVKINDVRDLLTLIETYPDDNTVQYNIDIHALHKIKKPLTNLNNMIGMKGLKVSIIDQILYYIQNLHKLDKTNVSADFMHTVIYGEPGTGKTEIAKIIGEIFANLGILKRGIFKKVTRSDLIAGYLGQTAMKTRDVIKDCLDGVLFIDEAYALGNNEKKDSFSKECIDTLCECLSAHKENLMVIIAGYESELNECFFNYNKGLESRFTWRFETEEYNAEELLKIFEKMVTDIGWSIGDKNKINPKWFEVNKQHFKYYGRDMESLLSKTKIAHSRRVFGLKSEDKKIIILNDLEQGLKLYLKNKTTALDKNKLSAASLSMYS
jgi:ATP-dependent 26S proteasome regulatory subunit